MLDKFILYDKNEKPHLFNDLRGVAEKLGIKLSSLQCYISRHNSLQNDMKLYKFINKDEDSPIVRIL